MKRLDIYIVIAVIVISIGLFLTFSLQSQENREVVISLKGEEYSRVKLDGKEHLFEIKTELGYNRIIVNADGVRIEEADCPDHDCVEIGSIKKVGQGIICAPHHLVIEIIGGEDTDLDGISI